MWTHYQAVKNVKALQAHDASEDAGAFATIADPGNAGTITATTSGIVNIVSTGADTRTLAAPAFNGQMLTIWHQTDGGSCATTYAAGFDEAGNNTYTSADDGDFITLVAMNDGGTLKWRAVAGGLAAGVFSDLSTV